MVVEAEETRDSLREDGDRANSHPGSGTLPARYKLLLFLEKKQQIVICLHNSCGN